MGVSFKNMPQSKSKYESISERTYIQDFNQLLNKFNFNYVQSNVEALYEMLDDFKPYIYGQFNLEIISMLKKMNSFIIRHEPYLPKYYFYCGQAYHFLREFDESKRYFRLAISYGIKYKKYRVVSYSIWNYEWVIMKERNIVHVDQITRLVASLYHMDESLYESYNRCYLSHLTAAYTFNQFDYVDALLKEVEPQIPKQSRDWIDLMIVKASVYRQRNQFIQAFQILSELYPKLNKKSVRANTIPLILNEIRLLSEHFDEMNDSPQVKTQLLNGYLSFINNNQVSISKVERIECKRLPFVSEKSVFVEKAEEILNEQNNGLFICIDIKSNMISETLLHTIQLKIVNEIYAEFNQRTLYSYALSASTMVFILNDDEQLAGVEKQVEKVLNLVKDQQLSMVVTDIFHFTVLSNQKYEVYNYKDAQNLANAFFYFELCKQV